MEKIKLSIYNRLINVFVFSLLQEFHLFFSCRHLSQNTYSSRLWAFLGLRLTEVPSVLTPSPLTLIQPELTFMVWAAPCLSYLLVHLRVECSRMTCLLYSCVFMVSRLLAVHWLDGSHFTYLFCLVVSGWSAVHWLDGSYCAYLSYPNLSYL